MVLYALSAVYFAGVMVRLMLTLTPVVCILSGVAFSGLLELFLREDDTLRPGESDAEEDHAVGSNRRLYDKVFTVLKYHNNKTLLIHSQYLFLKTKFII